MTFKRGKAPEASTEGRGGGVWVRNSKVDVEHSLFEDSSSKYKSTNSFTENAAAAGRGGALAITSVSTVTITHTTFQNNIAAVGGMAGHMSTNLQFYPRTVRSLAIKPLPSVR